jgi:predicted transcriptional regulator
MANCTYRFTDANGKTRVIKGQAAFKAYLASGGLEHLLPGTVIAPALSKRQTETPAFKKWFGDSKVVDANGDPLVMYRGQRKVAKPDRFVMTQGRALPSFASDPDAANVYALQLDTLSYGKGSNVMPVFLSMQNPLDIRSAGEEIALDELMEKLNWDFSIENGLKNEKPVIGYGDLADALEDLDELIYSTNAEFKIDAANAKGYRIKSFEKLADAITEWGEAGDIDSIELALTDVTFDTYLLGDSEGLIRLIEKSGYDGIIHKDVFDVGAAYYPGDKTKLEEGIGGGPVIDTYRPLEQTQIKSAIGNRGTFDVTNPDIRFSQRVPKLEPKDVLKPSTLAAAEAAIAKYKKAEAPDTLTAKQRADGAATLQPLFDAATRNKTDFDNTLDQIAEGLGGYAKKPGIKSVARAVTKLITENGNDPATMKDLLRGTIVVNTFQEAQEAINQIGKVYSFDRIKNRLAVNLTSPDGTVLEGAPLPTGYQDILTNVTLEDGSVAEIQISTPEMLAAKNLGHEIYAFEREMPKSPVKTKMVNLQKQIYSEGYNGYLAREAKALKTRSNSALSTGSPFSRTSEGLRGSGAGNQAVAESQLGATVTGTSFQSKNIVPGGKDLKSKSMSPSIPESIGINVNQDGNNKYADKIVDGKKTLETRASDSLRPYVGKRVAIVRTGEGPAKAIGAVTIGEPIKVTTQKQFDQYRDQSLVPKDSKFDIAPGGVKYLYPLENPVRYETERDVGQGIVARKVLVPVTRAAQKNAAASRVGNVSADRFKRTEQLQQAVADLQDGKITRTEYNRMVDQVRPVYPYKEMPKLTTAAEARYALATGKGQSPEKAAKYSLPSKTLKAGDWAQLRLDIPSYQLHDAWVVSVHTPKSTNREVQAAYDAGPVVGYESVGALTDVTFGMNQKAAAKIATGTAKGTIATVLGKWKPISNAAATVRAKAAMKDPAWVQVGMDPFRHSYFYNRDTMQPIVRADEVIQIGPLVLAKNPSYSEDVDITGAPFAFSKREEIVQIADDAARQEVFLQQKAEEAGYKNIDDFVDQDYDKFVQAAKQWREENPAEMMFQKRQTDTPEFKRWFGDSKVVDDQGEPMVVYRGAYDADKDGTFFSSKPQTASAYAAEEGGFVEPVYMRLANPLEVDAKGGTQMSMPYKGMNVGMTYLLKEAKKEGRDGVIVRDIADMVEDNGTTDYYVSLGKKAQVKSAIGNTGAFGEVNDIRFARKPMGRETEGWVLSRDELGRFRFGAGAKAYRYAADITNTVLDKINLKPISPELSRALRKMRVEVEKAQNLTVDVAKNLKDLPKQERDMISDVIEGELKKGAVPPQRVLDLAASMQSIMSEQTAELVRLGMLSPQAAGRWDGKYLPRFYEQKLGDETKAWAKAVKGLLARKTTMQGITGNSLKARGKFLNVPVSELDDWTTIGWEVRDDNFDPAVDDTITIWRDYTRQERDDMGEIRDAMFRFVMGYNKSQRDIALGRLYENLATNYGSKREEPGFVKVPATKIEDTMVPRYGKLANMWVPKEVLDQLEGFDQSMQNDLTKMYLKGLSMWKEGKTVLNPVAHANNVLSNLTMAHFAGVSYWDTHKYVGSIYDLVKGTAMVDEAKEAGLFGGTFNRAELLNILPEELKAMAQMTESAVGRNVDRLWNALSLFLRKPMGVAYDAEDQFFRYMIYREARNRGLGVDDSVDYAQKYIFTYDNLPKAARIIRDMPVGLPFFSYTFKAIPALANTALEHPFRYAAPAVALYTANAIMYAMAASLGGGDDEDWWTVIRRYVTDEEFRNKTKDMEKQERQFLPEWMKGASLSLGTEKTIRLGMDDLTNLPVFLDVSRIFPGGDLFDAHNNAGGVPLLAPLTPNNPILTTAAAMLFNKDTFRNKDIVLKTDTDAEAAQKRLAWTWKQVSPAIAVGNTHFERAMNVIANSTGQPVNVGLAEYTGIGADGLPIQAKYAAMQTVGIKARPIDLDTSEKIQASQTKAMIRDLDTEMRKLKRLESKGAITPETSEREREKLRQKKQFLREGLTVEGGEKD